MLFLCTNLRFLCTGRIFIHMCLTGFLGNKADLSASSSLNPSFFEGLVALCAPDAVCFSRQIPHASGRILAEHFFVIGNYSVMCRVGQRAFALFPLIKPYVRFSLIRLSDILLSTALCHAAISCKPFSCNRVLVPYSPFSFRVC